MFSSASTTSWNPDGSGRGDPLGVLGARGVGTQVHEHGEQVRPRDAVDQCVVRLGQHGPAPVLEPLDHPDLPERLRAVELLRHHAPDELAQLALAPRGGQRGVAQVVLDVEVRVVHPDRPPELEGDDADLLAVARDEVELGVDHGHDVGVRRRRALEDGHRGDVHVGHVVLDVEERRVQGAQAVRAHPTLPSGSCGPNATTGRSRPSWVSRRSTAAAGRPERGQERACRGSGPRSPRRRPR